LAGKGRLPGSHTVTEFRDGVTELDLQYVVGVQSSMTVWEPGKQPLPAKTINPSV
jgi:SRSO17 transposase